MALAPWEKELSKEQKAAASALGINNVNKQEELDRINQYVSAAKSSQSDPAYQQIAKQLGITNYNSVNDYAQVLNFMANPPAPPPPAPTPQPEPTPQPVQQAPAPIRQAQPQPQPTPVPEYQGPTMEDFSSLIEQMQIQSQQQIEALTAQFQQQEAQRLAEMEKLREEQRSMMINQARAVSPANLQLGIGYNQNKLAGTEGFKVRPKSTTPAPIAFSAPTLAASAASQVPTVLNV